jgi:hypothetical protein
MNLARTIPPPISGQPDNNTESHGETRCFNSRIPVLILTGQFADNFVSMFSNNAPSVGVIPFLRHFKLRVLLLSAVLVVPCVWHQRIEAGDLPSHVYNAWLAQLIARGQAPGLYIVTQWHNVLFDVTLLGMANLVGLGAAQKIVVAVGVLVFFWGAFAFISTISTRPPWILTPCIAMLAYGYSFSMGFMNYYLSLGLACFGMAILWRARRRDWIVGAMIASLAMLAHPIGFLWMVCTLAYINVRARVPGWWKLALPLAAVSAFAVVNWYASHHPSLFADWDRGPFYLYNGADQLAIYGQRYFYLAGAAFFFGIVCVASDLVSRRLEAADWKQLGLPFQLYAVTFSATALLPENLRPSVNAGWIGVLGSRLTTISAILGLCIFASLKLRKWHFAGFGLGAMALFAFLYQDTGWMNQLEANAEKLVENLPAGTRVIVTARAPADSRITFIGHAIERACIGHCFSYANYEPASGEFRIRVRKGSWEAIASTDLGEDMSSGEYELDDTDLPIKQIYQCDAGDLTKLCIRDLVAGETNGRLSVKLPSR